MSNPVIRFAEPKDIPALADMFEKFVDYFNNELDDAVVIPPKDVILRDMETLHFSDAPLLKTLVAESDDEIVGRLSFYKGWAANWYGRYHLSGMFVKKEFRGKAIAEKLFARLVEIAKEEKVRRIVWTNWRPNAAARKFYEKIGGKYRALGGPNDGDPDDDLLMYLDV